MVHFFIICTILFCTTPVLSMEKTSSHTRFDHIIDSTQRTTRMHTLAQQKNILQMQLVSMEKYIDSTSSAFGKLKLKTEKNILALNKDILLLHEEWEYHNLCNNTKVPKAATKKLGSLAKSNKNHQNNHC